MWFFKKLLHTRVPVLFGRLFSLFLVYALCRVVFYWHNRTIIGAARLDEWWQIVKASFVFDSGSIFYLNLPFIVMWLLPFDRVERLGWQRGTAIGFMVVNAVGLLVNVADIFYFPYKLSRIVSDDIHYLGEPTGGTLLGSMFVDYWQGTLLWLALVTLLYLTCFRLLRYRGGDHIFAQKGLRYAVRTVWLAAVVAFAVIGIRGYRTGGDAYPVNVSDAALFVRPEMSQVVLSNPFCTIRTWGNKLQGVTYMSRQEADSIYVPVRRICGGDGIARPRLPEGCNVVIIMLESFGAPHIKSLNPLFKPSQNSYTPFLDSLFHEGLLFTDAYQGGLKSIDAMPAVWASIPSYKKNFLRLPQSQADYYAFPKILADNGYATSFMHGASRESMSFVSFGKMAGVQGFVSREDYSKACGDGDFDGKWGIWDDRFLPFALGHIDALPRPFMATIFTLSSHEPFKVPPHMEGRFEEGALPIHKVMRYTDHALREFFREASAKPWFANTLFVIMADHGSGAEDARLLGAPYNHHIPIFFYMPSAELKGRIDKTVSQLDIMPTLLAMMGYEGSVVAFGNDMFDTSEDGFAVGYFDGSFGVVEGSLFYRFSEQGLAAVYDIDSDPGKERDIKESADPARVRFFEAYIQQYYRTVADRAFMPQDWSVSVVEP